MTIKKHSILYFSIILLFGFVSCSSSKDTTKSPQHNVETPDEATALYLDGVKQRILENYEEAKDLFLEVLEKKPNHGPANYDLARIEQEEQNYVDAENHIRKAVKAEPENKWYQISLAEILKEQQKLEESIKVYERIIDQFEDNPRLYFEIAMMYVYLGEYDNAIKYYDKIENSVGINERLSVQKQKLYKQLGKTEKAIAELKKLVESQPDNVKYYNLLAKTYVEDGQYEKAQEAYEKVKMIDPGNAFVHINLADLYRKQDKRDKAYQELKKGFAQPQLDLDTKIQILVTYYSVSEMYSGQKAQTFTLAKTLVETHPDKSEAHSVYADFLNKDNKKDKAKKHFRKAIDLDNSRFFNWENYLNILMQQSEYELLIEEADEAKDLFPVQPVLYLFSGLAHLQLDQFNKAQEELLTGVDMVAGNQRLEAQFNIYLGEVYHELEEYEKSDGYFEKAIEEDPENSFTLNNYSYYLSLRGEKLKTAEKYARKAVEIDPDNPNNQDTYGWVLFKMERYEEAKYWIQKAIDNSDNPSGTILEHMGDVLYELDEKQQALEYWNEAHKAGETTPELEKKIEQEKRITE